MLFTDINHFCVICLETEMMMELHDNFLSIYSHYFALEEFFHQMKETVEAKRDRFNVRVLYFFLIFNHN